MIISISCHLSYRRLSYRLARRNNTNIHSKKLQGKVLLYIWTNRISNIIYTLELKQEKVSKKEQFALMMIDFNALLSFQALQYVLIKLDDNNSRSPVIFFTGFKILLGFIKFFFEWFFTINKCVNLVLFLYQEHSTITSWTCVKNQAVLRPTANVRKEAVSEAVFPCTRAQSSEEFASRRRIFH